MCIVIAVARTTRPQVTVLKTGTPVRDLHCGDQVLERTTVGELHAPQPDGSGIRAQLCLSFCDLLLDANVSPGGDVKILDEDEVIPGPATARRRRRRPLQLVSWARDNQYSAAAACGLRWRRPLGRGG